MNCLAIERVLFTEEDLFISNEVKDILMDKKEIREYRAEYIGSLPYYIGLRYDTKDKDRGKGAKEPKFDTKKMSKKELKEYEV